MKVWKIHRNICSYVETVQEEINEEELRQQAKKQGVKNWWNKSIDTLLNELEGK